MPSSPLAVNIRVFIDGHRFGRYQIRVTSICALLVFLDGFDTQAIGYVAPAIVQSFHIDRAALSPVFSASLAGLMIGSLAGGPLSDHFGRRPVSLAGVACFGLLSCLTVLAPSIGTLMVLRFLTGLGLGCVMPNMIALTSEFAPARVRATAVMLMFCGFSLGAALGGLVAAALIHDWGWRSVFIVGGTLPCLALMAAWRYLPESPRFLINKGGNHERIRIILSQIDRRIDGMSIFEPDTDEAVSRASSLRMLFADRRRALTVLLWVIFFMSLMDLYFLSNWMPTVIHDAGIPLEKAALIAAMLQIGGTVGTLTLGKAFDRLAPFLSLAAVYFLAMVFIMLIGYSSAIVPVLVMMIFGAGFCVVGGQIGANALAASSYPTAIRSTGVGWALGIGRMGSIIGPGIGGVILSLNWDTRRLFTLAAVPMLLASLAALAISIAVKRELHKPTH